MYWKGVGWFPELMGRLENEAQGVDRLQISSCLRLEMEGSFPEKGHKETFLSDGNILYLGCNSDYMGYIHLSKFTKLYTLNGCGY